MPSRRPDLPKAPVPTRVFFDPFNSSSTGHQVDPNRLSGSTRWRDSRAYKLSHQFKDRSGGGGQKHLSDLVGAGSPNWLKDGRKENGDWEADASGLREQGWQDIRGLLGNSRKRKSQSVESELDEKRRRTSSEPPPLSHESISVNDPEPREKLIEDGSIEHDDGDDDEQVPQIFRGLTMYLNGSTMPLVSDHRLKQLFAQHGGNSSMALGRRTVTHVVLGEQGAGGGLAASKIQKENTTVRGKSIKYVSAKWILDSIEKGIRQPESRYLVADVRNRLGGSNQPSVASLFRANSK